MTAGSSASLETVIRNRLKNTLGSTGSFFVPTEPGIPAKSDFRELLTDPEVSKELDPVALCEFPSHYAFFGSRTILREVRRTDWYADDHVELFDEQVGVPRHGQRTMAPKEVAHGFVERLLEETRERIRGCKHVGILLSGGMDSRIVAAALAEVQRSSGDLNVTCFTWGQPDTRDIIYADKIAKHYGWGFEHFAINAETFWDNVVETAQNGCFHSAMHLHAMPSVARRAVELGVELMLAGSYGDSVGRAEYSGSHVSELPPIENRIRNWYGLLNADLFGCCKNETEKEIKRCRKLYGKKSSVAEVELDRQLHYMRNMLGSALTVIEKYVPLAQAFTSRPIVEFMWSLTSGSRSDQVYYYVLGRLDPDLLQIPWSRTGKPFLRPEVKADGFKKSFHEYATWARDNLDRIEQSVFSGAIEDTNAFNLKAVNKVFYAFKKYPFVQSGRILESIIWLASLNMLLNEVRPPPVKVGSPPKFLAIRHRLQLYGTLARQYQSFECGHPGKK